MEVKIDRLKYKAEENPADEKNISQVSETPFTNGPAEFLVQEVVRRLREVKEWKLIFGDFIDYYMRMDYGMTNLPALRVYNNVVTKEFESWFVSGELIADIILPPVLRRTELQQIQDTLSMALLQQFRRPTFFDTLMERVPGLNELGKSFSVDKSLGYEQGENMVPLTQIRINFRLDLRVWDEYLEATDRTKDSPFEKVLGDLRQIATTIQGLKEGEDNAEVTIGIDQKTTGD